jgi:hypothetical protein
MRWQVIGPPRGHGCMSSILDGSNGIGSWRRSAYSAFRATALWHGRILYRMPSRELRQIFINANNVLQIDVMMMWTLG